MLEILAHSDLPHQFVLVSIHASELPNVSECVLQSVCQLECIHVTKTILHVRVNYQLRQTKDLSTKMKGVSKSRLLSLLCRERLDWLEVEVVVEMEVVEVLAMDEQIEHVVALTTNLEANLNPVKLSRLEELCRFERSKQIPMFYETYKMHNHYGGDYEYFWQSLSCVH